MSRSLILTVGALTLFVASCGKLNTLNSVSSDGSISSGSSQFVAFKSLFSSKCNSCHSGWTGRTEDEWKSEVALSSRFRQGDKIVVPGNADQSVLFLRLSNNGVYAGSEADMGGSNSAAEIAIVRDWINSLSP